MSLPLMGSAGLSLLPLPQAYFALRDPLPTQEQPTQHLLLEI